MDNEKRIVRFAPSPTGHLHVGGARTALFNYLFVKTSGGKFLLRIEDTDKERSTEEMAEEIIEGLDWLGLVPDEPPRYQSEHINDHMETAMKLLHDHKAYRCFCAKEETEERRVKDGKINLFMYDRFCLKLSQPQINEKLKNRVPFVVRFRVPEGETVFKDRIHKEVKTANSEIEDFILVRSNGTPTYQLSVVSDDMDMGITDVIRGDDHISNTFKQILLFLALGKKPPRYSHLPLILGPDKKKLSKRHGETSILEFKYQGYLPEAVTTYLSQLSWSPSDHKKIYPLEELIREFRIASISKNSPVFDYNKLISINSRAIQERPPEDLSDIIFTNRVMRQKFEHCSRRRLAALIELVKPRMKKLGDFNNQLEIYLSDSISYSESELEKLTAITTVTAGYLNELADSFSSVSTLTAENAENILRNFADENNINAGNIIHPLRFALTGTTVSPPIFNIVEFLGSESVIKRIRMFTEFLRKNVLSD